MSAPFAEQKDLEAQTSPTGYVRVHAVPVVVLEAEDPCPAMLPCAVIGALCSFIPLIGCLTYAVNWDAPQHTSRRRWANAALAVALVVIVVYVAFCVIFFSLSIARRHHMHCQDDECGRSVM